MNEHLKRAMEALEMGAADLRRLSTGRASEIRNRLRSTVEEVLVHLEADDDEPEDVFSQLDRKSKDIAEDLRRVERLMRERGGGA